VQGLHPGNRTLYASWHSRAAAGVAPARVWLAGRGSGPVPLDCNQL
jgi:hypothetical protein